MLVAKGEDVILCRFQGKSKQEIREITFGIGMLGKYGLDINDPKSSHVLRTQPGRTSILQVRNALIRRSCCYSLSFKVLRPKSVR